MNEDDEIFAALERIAFQAPQPDRVVAGLSARLRAHRQRRALLALGGATVGAAAVGVPVFFVLRPDGGTPTPVAVPLSAQPEPSPRAGNTWAPLLMRPTWLPDGVSEISRLARTGGRPRQSRLWADQTYRDLMLASTGDMDERARKLAATRFVVVDVTRPVDPGPTRTGVPATQGPASDPLVLGGEANTVVGTEPAHLSDPTESDIAEISWLVGDLLVKLAVSPAAGGYDAVARVAASVVADRHLGVEAGMSFGWLPERAKHLPMEVRATVTGTEWSQGIEIFNDDLDGEDPGVRASLSSSKPVGLAEPQPVTVRGRRGMVTSDGEAVVQLADGPWLTVAGRGSSEAQRIANGLVIGPPAYRGWAGTR